MKAHHRNRFNARVLRIAAMMLAYASAGAGAQTDFQPVSPALREAADKRCMQCHAQPHIAELNPGERRAMVGTLLDPDAPPPEVSAPATEPLATDEPATRPGLYVPPGHFVGGPHAELRCIDCHTDASRLPHEAKLNTETCATACHAQAASEYAESDHAAALTRADERAPTCASCHGGHDILRVDDRKAPQHRLNSLHLCGDCHADHGSSEEGVASAERVASYLESAHAKGITESGLRWAATCSDCHGAHGVHKSDDPRSTVNRVRVPETCGSCHEGISEIYGHSIHGKLLAEGDDRGPVCTDCHTAHSITHASSPEFMLDIIGECGQCHDKGIEETDRKATFYETYSRSYHGQVSRLGSTRAARCSDCHGAHDILPGDDPSSRVNQQNLIATCSQTGCHPGANANFVRFDPHADYRDRKNYPILYGVWWYFIIVMSSVFTFFGLHTLLWFLRSMLERIKKGPPPAHDHEPTAIRRFTNLNRVNHALVAITFFGLTATGIPLVFSHEPWAGVLAGFWGGIEASGTWHRVFATMLIVNFVLHFIGLGRSFLHRKVSWKQWVFGPNSLVPRWKDVADCVGMFRWFAGRGRLPRFDRWAYWEKFDYWAEVFGSMIIGGTGLLLWFPELASKILPGWVFNVATIIHGYEALLAIGFIFTIHFFNAHVRPGTFPVDEVIFTGSVPEAELRETRPEEYDRLVRTGELEALRVPAPKRHKAPLLVFIAVVSVGIGLGLLVLIILGGLSML